jgi:hypothetical protein
MKTLRTEIGINAPPSSVWEVLTDFPSFPDWNPFVREAKGELREGACLHVTLQAGERKPFTARPRLRRVQPNRELRWLGRLGLPGLFDADHVFRIEPRDDGRTSLLIHEEHFRGVLVPIFWKGLETDTREAFEAMNVALKIRVEGA